jgi:hypothetical protein
MPQIGLQTTFELQFSLIKTTGLPKSSDKLNLVKTRKCMLNVTNLIQHISTIICCRKVVTQKLLQRFSPYYYSQS